MSINARLCSSCHRFTPRGPKQRLCLTCHAVYMRGWRARHVTVPRVSHGTLADIIAALPKRACSTEKGART